jgi:hypothetical protein
MDRKTRWLAVLAVLAGGALLAACTVSIAGGLAGLAAAAVAAIAILVSGSATSGCDVVGPCLSIAEEPQDAGPDAAPDAGLDAAPDAGPDAATSSLDDERARVREKHRDRLPPDVIARLRTPADPDT